MDGTWPKILDKVILKDDAVGEVEWIISVDSSVIRAHQHAAGARKKRGCSHQVEALVVDGEYLGRSQGGLSSKIHLSVDARGLPMNVILTGGQAGDNPQLIPLLDGLNVRRDGPGRPRPYFVRWCAAAIRETGQQLDNDGLKLSQHSIETQTTERNFGPVVANHCSVRNRCAAVTKRGSGPSFADQGGERP